MVIESDNLSPLGYESCNMLLLLLLAAILWPWSSQPGDEARLLEEGTAKRIIENWEIILIKTCKDFSDMWANKSDLLLMLIWVEV